MKSTSNFVCINGKINTLEAREAMGLNNSYVAMRYDNIYDTMDKLRPLKKDSLLALIDSRNSSLRERYASGQLLALVGDPRINTFKPEMRSIPAAQISIGLEKNLVDTVVCRYKNVGVLKEWIEKETPRFSTTVKAFNLGVYPVTNLEYHDYLGSVPNGEIPTSWQFGRYPSHLANHPVATISDVAATDYAQWLSEKTNRSFRLPTEIEWEYAAAGSEGFEFPWGNEFNCYYANTAELGLFATTPVGIFVEGVSPFGLLDMSGNVEEYTASDYWVYPGGEHIEDDLLATTKNYKVARGGSYTRFSDLARCRRRHGRYNKDIYVMGFRLAEDN